MHTVVEYLLFVYQLIVHLSTIINYCAKVISLYLFSVQKRGKLCLVAFKRLWISPVRGFSAVAMWISTELLPRFSTVINRVINRERIMNNE